MEIRNKIPHVKACKFCSCEFKKKWLAQIYCCMKCRVLDSCIKENNGCWIWTKGKDLDGYGVISKNNKTHKAHRISYEIFVGEIPKGKHVCHKCDIPSCINPEHLFLATNKENMYDKINKGRDKVKGEQSSISILNDEIVKTIRELHAKLGWRQKDIAELFGLSKEHVYAIIHKKIWKHVVSD